MALGGGIWLTESKILPGAYINFVSAARASNIFGDRGYATMPFISDWGPTGEVVTVAAGDFQRDSLSIFGYDYTAPQMKPLREMFRNIQTGYIYRLGSGGVKASNAYATALYAGERGNALIVVAAVNADNSDLYDVTLLLDGTTVFSQTVAVADDLAANAFVAWTPGALAPTATAGTPLAGGVSPTVTNADYQSYLDAIESYSFNALCCPSGDPLIKQLFAQFTINMRDNMGVKFQCVVFGYGADHEGVVNVMNNVTDAGAAGWELVYWVTGVIAGTAVNRSALNRIYDGEYTVNVNNTQTQLIAAINGGQFAFHRVASADIRVLADINSLVTVTADKGDVFKENQTIRVIDQIGNDIALIFNTRYIGIVPNDAEGRISFWSEIVNHHNELQDIRAIQNFTSEDVTVAQGATKSAVLVSDAVEPVGAMAKLYMTVTVS